MSKPGDFDDLFVSYHQMQVLSADLMDVGLYETGGRLLTGLHTGTVRARARPRRGAPPEAELAAWEAVEEATV